MDNHQSQVQSGRPGTSTSKILKLEVRRRKDDVDSLRTWIRSHGSVVLLESGSMETYATCSG